MGAVTLERPAKASKLKKIQQVNVREGLDRALRVSRRIFVALGQQQVLVTAALLAVLLVSALGVVHSTQKNRELFNTLATLQAERDGWQREWSQLLLEQSALSAHGLIEYRASQDLAMTVPGRNDIVLVPASISVPGK